MKMNHQRYIWLLIVCDNNIINEPLQFHNYEDAYFEMKTQYRTRRQNDDLSAVIEKDYARISNNKHNIAWKIQEIKIDIALNIN